jgi:hypothetical protein
VIREATNLVILIAAKNRFTLDPSLSLP